jgi:heme-degrading monooxygenase HmoA
MIRSILYLHPRGGDARAVAELYRRREVLEVAVAQDGCLAAELQLPVDASGPVIVTALWDTPEAYQRWIDNPARAASSDELDELVEAPVDSSIRHGDLYEVVLTATAAGTDA